MAKVLISSIGAGQKSDGGYRTTKYEMNGEIKETPFISKALSDFLKIDKLFLVGTKASIWESVYTEFGGEEKAMELYEKQESKTLSLEDLKPVEEVISRALGSSGSRCFLIDYGVDEKELWNNFSIYLQILEYIQSGDEVYIDITHSFRSLALMSFLMVQFGQTIKKKDFRISGIYYGMYEYAGENGSIAPIVDLKIFYDLLEWMKAIENLTNYGNADKIVNLLENKNEKNLFNHFTLSLRMANLAAIRSNVESLSRKFNIIDNSSNPIVQLLSPQIKEFITRLDKKSTSEFQLAMAEWFWEHKHYALGYIALVESIVTKVCEKLGYKKGYKEMDKDEREKAKKEVSKVDKELYFDIYKSANQIRNDIAHQSGKRKDSLLQDARSLQTYIQKTQKIFQRLN